MIGGCFGEKGFAYRGMYIRSTLDILPEWKDVRNADTSPNWDDTRYIEDIPELGDIS